MLTQEQKLTNEADKKWKFFSLETQLFPFLQ